jgi:hypothetical protein
MRIQSPGVEAKYNQLLEDRLQSWRQFLKVREVWERASMSSLADQVDPLMKEEFSILKLNSQTTIH